MSKQQPNLVPPCPSPRRTGEGAGEPEMGACRHGVAPTAIYPINRRSVPTPEFRTEIRNVSSLSMYKCKFTRIWRMESRDRLLVCAFKIFASGNPIPYLTATQCACQYFCARWGFLYLHPPRITHHPSSIMPTTTLPSPLPVFRTSFHASFVFPVYRTKKLRMRSRPESSGT